MIDNAFFLLSNPASKNASAGIIPNTSTVQISTQPVSPVSI